MEPPREVIWCIFCLLKEVKTPLQSMKLHPVQRFSGSQIKEKTQLWGTRFRFKFLSWIAVPEGHGPQAHLTWRPRPSKHTATSSRTSPSLFGREGARNTSRQDSEATSTVMTKLMSKRERGRLLGLWPAPSRNAEWHFQRSRSAGCVPCVDTAPLNAS